MARGRGEGARLVWPGEGGEVTRLVWPGGGGEGKQGRLLKKNIYLYQRRHYDVH